MRTYMWVRIISALICAISLYLGIRCNMRDFDLASNILIGVFGSSLLTYISALISYKISKRDAIISYLGTLQAYRCRFQSFRKHYFLKEWDKAENDLQNLNEYFYEMHYTAYLKIQHLMYWHSTPKTINKAFEKMVTTTSHLRVLAGGNIQESELTEIESNINSSITIIENLARKKNYLK